MIHVAVLLKPYLDMILSGEKTVECRLTRQARDPFERIEPGERIYFKQSAGEYGAMAVADHVMCEANLTSRRIKELKRDYNHLIRGENAYWEMKSQSRFATLIWLREVTPVDHGPHIRPLQGVAWLCLEEEPAWRRAAPCRNSATLGDNGPPASFSIVITEGNITNGTLYVRGLLDRFPPWCIGGPTKAQAARPITLSLHDGPTVQTDIVGDRHLLRTRVWRNWFRRHKAAAGDRVGFVNLGNGRFDVGLLRATSECSCPPPPPVCPFALDPNCPS